MTTSGTSTFDAKRDQIINAAYRKIGVIGEDDVANSYQIDNAAFILEGLLKEAEVDGMPLWAIVEQTIPCSEFTNGSITLGIGMEVNIPAPLKVIHAYNRDLLGNIDIPLTVLTHHDYNWLSSKYNRGTPVQFFYNPGNQVGELKLWPTPDQYAIDHREIHITYQRPFEDAGDSNTTLDFPPYWNTAIIYNLALRMAPDSGLTIAERQLLQREASAFWERALGFGTEEGSLFVNPDWTRMYLGQRNR